MNRGVDPSALPALFAMVALFVCAVCWLWRGFPLVALGWLVCMPIPFFIRKWGQS